MNAKMISFRCENCGRLLSVSWKATDKATPNTVTHCDMTYKVWYGGRVEVRGGGEGAAQGRGGVTMGRGQARIEQRVSERAAGRSRRKLGQRRGWIPHVLGRPRIRQRDRAFWRWIAAGKPA